MTVIRQAHRKNYVTLSNKLAQNNNLSLRARGLLLYLLSLPDDWEIHLNHLIKNLKEGRRVILSSLNELKSAGYIYHHKMGFSEGWNYFVFEVPTNENEFKEFLRTIPVYEQFQNANNCQDVHLQRTKCITKDPLDKKNPPHTPPLRPNKIRKKEEDFSNTLESREETYQKTVRKWLREDRPVAVVNKALEAYANQPLGAVKDIAKWMEKVYLQKLEEIKMDELVEFRRRYALKYSANFVVGKTYVSYMHGSIEEKYSLRGSEEFWKSKGLGVQDYLKRKGK